MAEVASKSTADNPRLGATKRHARSSITNGRLVDADGRSAFARRLRDVWQLLLDDLGAGAASEAERSLLRRAAVLTVQLEALEAGFAQAEASAEHLDLYGRLSGHLRRLLETVGVRRRASEVVDLKAYLATRGDGR